MRTLVAIGIGGLALLGVGVTAHGPSRLEITRSSGVAVA
jgi:hypothetical protein